MPEEMLDSSKENFELARINWLITMMKFLSKPWHVEFWGEGEHFPKSADHSFIWMPIYKALALDPVSFAGWRVCL